ncbi:ORC2-domain-containing protein [Parathielavia appendiculata]|uniref:Origin recognition complex subunit 2 n=1 Tax=Parathielavia appendiculata TaxID=2587402 RepID=A0AAN6U9D6_9PEZI|nr:ORC2-domain-containing protein [Parathielavia appendiculata]
MARKKTAREATALRPSRKREAPVDPYEVPDEGETPRRRRRLETTDSANGNMQERRNGAAEDAQTAVETTPAKRRGRPPKSAAAGTPMAQATTPSAKRPRSLAETPVKVDGLDTPSRRNIADRSARRKSARALIDRVMGGTVSEDEVEEGDIAREIYESSEAEEEGQEGQEEAQEPTAPSKSPGRKRRAAARKRSPTPPRDLPPHEQYFYQNKPGLAKTSNNTLSSLDLLTHDEYFSVLRQLKDPHAADVNFLQNLHAESFAQWAFELSQGFSTCLYGYGSKRRLLHSFATYLSSQNPHHKVVIVNGYVRTLTARDILSTLTAAFPSPLTSNSSGGGGVGLNPSTTLQTLLTHLSTTSSSSGLTILVNSVDFPALRKPALQSLLSRLAAHSRIHLACTADTPNFPLLWDAGLRASFNFLFHDCTTFAPYGPCELEVVDEVHELLGRKSRRAGGKEGVAFVLRSLPENARALFRLLVGEVLVAMEEEQGGRGVGGGGRGGEEVAVEYKMVYNKAVEEFICSSEMAFRTLLKEFHDHQIITSHKDSIGTELLSLPFRKEELESILEELMS